MSSFQGLYDVIRSKGLFSSFYTDRGSHYWLTPEAGGKVDKQNLTQVGRALHQLGIEHIPAYSPEARGRSERMFGTLQGRLPQELRLAGITDMDEGEPVSDGAVYPATQQAPCPSTGRAGISIRALHRQRQRYIVRSRGTRSR